MDEPVVTPTRAHTETCPIARTLGVLRDRWTFLLLREAMFGRRTFREFRTELQIASDVLTARLGELVEAGIFERVPYQEPGQRTRHAYHLTEAGRELVLVLVGLQQWGETHLPVGGPRTVEPRAKESRRAVRAVFVDDEDVFVDATEVRYVPCAVPDSPAPGSASTPGRRSRR